MSLLGWGLLMIGVWVALNVVVYGVLDWRARNTDGRKDGSVWLLGEGTVIDLNEGTPFHVALITIVVMMLLLAVMPAFFIADWVDLRRQRTQQH
jgi:hypothetical protein